MTAVETPPAAGGSLTGNPRASESAFTRGNGTVTHEDYLSAIVAAVIEHAPQHADRLRAVKLVYGTGAGQ